jgi:hypothetical protein
MADSRAWLRLYTEFAFDPKVQLLDETLQRRYVMLLCLAGAGITPTSDVSQVDFALRIGVSKCEETRSSLVARGLITDDWFPTAWDKRQFQSDSSTERVKRFRKRHRDVPGGATGTASEQSRTEQSRTEQSRESRSARASRLPDDFVLTDERRLVAEAERLPAERTFSKFTDYWRSASGSKARKLDWDATWRVWCRTETDRNKPLNGGVTRPAAEKPQGAYARLMEANRDE